MGKGLELICNDCGNHHGVFLGYGMMFPSVYEQTVQDILAGCYGKEWQELAAQTEHFAIDARNHLFRCEHCGFGECVPSASIYAPNEVKKAAREPAIIYWD